MSGAIHLAIQVIDRALVSPKRRAETGKRPSFETILARHTKAVYEEVSARPEFQNLARWSVDNLAPGSHSPTRRLVDKTDSALRGSAKNLLTLAKNKAFRSGLRTRLGAVRSESQEPPQTVATFTRHLEELTNPPWPDLVNVQDFFHPQPIFRVWRDTETGEMKRIQDSEFTSFFTEQLRLPGDFIFRCATIRVSQWARRLRGSYQIMKEAVRKHANLLTDLRKAMRNWQTPMDSLTKACEQEELSTARRSAVELVQLAAAFHQQSDFSWLGPAASGVALASELRRQNELAALAEHFALALRQLDRFFGDEPDAEALIQISRDSAQLCLIARPGNPAAWWQGQKLSVDWRARGRAWSMLFALAKAAKQGRAIDAMSGVGVSLKDARGDLKKLLPGSLDDLIVSAGRGTYRLTAAADQIYVGQVLETERLESAAT